MKRLNKIPTIDRPRERLSHRGATQLSDTELLAIVVGRGVKGFDAIQVAREILKLYDRTGSGVCPPFSELKNIRGVGETRAAQFIAAQEFFQRRLIVPGVKIEHPEDFLPFIQHLRSKRQEHLVAATVGGAHELLNIRTIAIGTLSSVQVHPREVFADAIGDRAAGLILAHNHPSGNPAPSSADLRMTNVLRKAGKIVGIPLLDHLIFSRDGFFSFAQEGYFEGRRFRGRLMP